ncbi:MAG TPA: hypothetical protein VMD91_07955 [Candidatus Sulfotelmatobacter sp.]|nr:hypothetical protein [Candidatus Sulfotelmatobacter sp.]
MKHSVAYAFRLLALAVAAGIAIASSGSTASAQAAPGPETVALQYLTNLGFTSVTFPSGVVESNCPTGYRCTFGFLALVPYEVGGNGGGVALVAMGTLTNPNAGSVIANVGGAMDVADLESYGVVASQAESLISQFDAL